MGVDFYCGDVTFGCSYGGWNTLRTNVIKATFEFIHDRFQREEELYKNITDEEDEHYIGDGSTYYCYKKQIIELIEAMKNTKNSSVFGINIDNTINNFINLCRNLHYVDALIYFDIGGLYAFCNKSDCEGYYSVGNSLDICQLFDLIEPFIEKNYKDTYSAIYKQEDRMFGNRAYDLFKESANTNKKIIIR